MEVLCVPMVAAPAWTDKILSASKRLALEEWLVNWRKKSESRPLGRWKFEG